VVEPHIVANLDAIAERAMTIEEAVKEVESGDHDLLVFRNRSGEAVLLHRRRDARWGCGAAIAPMNV